MQVDTMLNYAAGADWDSAISAEQQGYDCAWMGETRHDPFLALSVAGTRTERIKLGTAIIVAFARTPMVTAVAANDVHLYSKGRFILGLGSQVKPHIEKRFSMPWSEPAARMREYIEALRAIWHAWETGEKLSFRGDFYTHTIMTPMFDPGPNPYGNPDVVLAGVGPLMTKVAAEVADGFFVHGFTTERYLREVTMPALQAGRSAAGKTMADFHVSGLPFVCTGTTEEELEQAKAGTRKQIAFYGSTPAYKPVLELHGWGDLADELNVLSKRGEWDEMGRRIDDDVLDAFAVVAEPDRVADVILDRFGDLLTRCSIYSPYRSEQSVWGPVVAQLQKA